ncbi:uncharacterized protein B0P05DRAFT_34640 [Gilbertella persicaria]|uniref:uncharacterized protein n=1 Tax=Gilbertella persicaria TaxID=101096 RepID=UPI00222000E4|nr:uncharacterized protein B0P05DRAFT_34640 [Gilbertella persicaria]KAI8084311.1 hypothetical protein B0P05DRAFT_34640 [Gilbertella persicaria]
MDYHQYPPDMNNMMARQNDRSSPSFNTVVNQYMFNERSPSIMFDSNAIHSPPILSEEGNNSMMMMSTHPVPPVVPVSQNFQGPWNHPMLNVNDYAGSSRRQHQSTPSERGIAGFVSKLYQCLQSPENNQNYARWCQHDGKDMFVIDCIPEFTEIVLPRLFKHCKFASFVRQLNVNFFLFFFTWH